MVIKVFKTISTPLSHHLWVIVESLSMCHTLFIYIFTDEEPPKLEPEPAVVNLPEDFPNEEKWSSYPMTQAQSAFSQYREFVSYLLKSVI